MLVSVIIPMYNVEKYLEDCLNSLKRQTLQDIEFILVNDGSTDHTVEIAEKYAQEDPEHFLVLTKKNGGLSDARNFGIPYAKGRYIAFLDSDDFVEPDCYEQLVSKMNDATDVVVGDIEYYYENPSQRFVMKGLSEWNAESIQKKALLSPMFAWNKLYRASLFQGENGYRYPVGTWYEDNPVTTMIFAKASNIGYADKVLFHYRQREGSIMSNSSDPRIHQIFDVMKMIRSNFQANGLADQYHDELEYLHIEHLCLYGMFRFIRSDSWEKYYEEAQIVMKENYPNYKANPYIKNLSLSNRLFLKFYNKHTAFIFHLRIR